MRLSRVKAEGQGFYHAMSRTVPGLVIFDTSGKRCANAEEFRSRMWALATFCGVQILDYSLMPNHFHLVFEVPEPRPLSIEEVLERVAALHPEEAQSAAGATGPLSRATRWPGTVRPPAGQVPAADERSLDLY